MEGKSLQTTLDEVSKNGKAKGIMLTCEDIAASQLQAGVRGFLGRKAISDANLQQAQQRRLLVATEKGGALTLDDGA